MMAYLSREAKVGIFVLVGILILGYFTLRVGKVSITEKGYTVYSDFDTVSGLDEKSVVKMAGVPIGQIEEITLIDGRARVSMRISEGVEIPLDSSVSLSSEGLLGEKYIEIVPGKVKEKFIEPGGKITRSVAGADVEEFIKKMTYVADDLSVITSSLADALGDEDGRESLKEIVKNLRETTRAFNELVASNREDFKALISNMRALTETLKEKTPLIAEKLESAADNMAGLVTDNRENLREAISNMKSAAEKLDRTMERLDKGEGTLGKLMTDDKAYDDFSSTMDSINRFVKKKEALQTHLLYRMEFLEGSSDIKQYASLKIQPSLDRYYLFGIVDDPLGRVRRTTTITTQTPPGTTVETEQIEIKDDLKFDAYYAKKFSDLTFKGGLLESTAGVGIAYNALSDRMVFGMDFFDFNRRENKPHLKFYGNYSIFKNLYITAGYDDFINDIDRLRNLFIGFGIDIRDEDLKTLFSVAPPVSP